MRIKGWLITGAVLILLGAVLLGAVLTVARWDFTRLSATKYETKTYTLTEEYQSVCVVSKRAQVTFVPSEDGTTRVECVEETRLPHAVGVENGTLTVAVQNNRRWYDYVGFHFGAPQVTVYLPRGAYDTLTVETDTGDVRVPADFTFSAVNVTGHTGDITFEAPTTGDVNLKVTTGAITVQNVSTGNLSLTASTGRVTATGVACTGDLTLKVSTGKAELTDVTCENLTSDGNTGDIALEYVVARGKLTVTRSTGDVLLTRCNAASLQLTTDTGDVKGSLLSDKIFFASSDTGRIDVPKTTTGGRCEITTDTGDIRMEITQ